MALTRTTLAGAVAATDTEVTLTTIAGLAVSQNINVDGEVMRVLAVGAAATVPVGVLRGIRGSNVAAHPSGATATFGPPADFSSAPKSKPTRRDVVSYSANGVVANTTPGRDAIAVLNGTSTLTMTLANPAKDNEGDMLIVVSNGKAAHTLTYTTVGLGGGGAATDLITFSVVAQMSVVFIAVTEVWVLVGGSSGAGSVAASTVIT
jgi:hypothetical protein